VTEPQPITAVESNRDNAGGRDFDKDSPLREDIRMLGRLLGDTIRDQEGADVFDLGFLIVVSPGDSIRRWTNTKRKLDFISTICRRRKKPT
jgi:phosphoenolpyruvate carboxylase